MMQRSAFDDSLPEAKNNTHALSPKGSSLSSISEQGVDQSVNESPDKDSGELPKGWIAVPSNSRPGQVSYMNIFTQKRQQLKPRQIAPEASTDSSRGGTDAWPRGGGRMGELLVHTSVLAQTVMAPTI